MYSQKQIDKNLQCQMTKLSYKMYQVFFNTYKCLNDTYEILHNQVNIIQTNNALNRLPSIYVANCFFMAIFNEISHDKRLKEHARNVMVDLYHQYKYYPTKFEELNVRLDTFKEILMLDFMEKPFELIENYIESDPKEDAESIREIVQEVANASYKHEEEYKRILSNPSSFKKPTITSFGDADCTHIMSYNSGKHSTWYYR
jgi:hypothetical protein